VLISFLCRSFCIAKSLLSMCHTSWFMFFMGYCNVLNLINLSQICHFFDKLVIILCFYENVSSNINTLIYSSKKSG
jgi:hypothetical protein